MDTSPNVAGQGLNAASSEPIGPRKSSGRILWVIAFVVLLAMASGTPTARAAWQQMAQFLSLRGKPEPASANVLSEHEIEDLDRMSPQAQAGLLLERSINHYQGANDQIAVRVAQWRGNIRMQGRLNNLFVTAINSDE